LFWVDGITNLLAAFLLWRFLSPAHAPVQTVHAQKKEQHTSAYKDRLYIWFIVLTTVFAICFFQNFTILPVYLKEQLELNEYFIGLVLGFNGVLIALFEMVIVFKLEGKRHGLFYISLGTLFVGVSYVILNIFHFMPEIIALVSITLVTIGEILAMPFMNSFWVARTTMQNRGQYASLYTIAYSAAQVVAPTFGAQIVQHFNFNILWWLIGGISVFTVFGYQWLQREVCRR
jgi:predicted MFS family arabinose efflux permease